MGTYQLRHMRPHLTDLLHELDAFRESVSFLFSDGSILGKAQLQFDGCYYSGAVTQQGIRHEEPLVLEVVDEVDNPCRVRRYQVGSMLEEDFRNSASEIAQA